MKLTTLKALCLTSFGIVLTTISNAAQDDDHPVSNVQALRLRFEAEANHQHDEIANAKARKPKKLKELPPPQAEKLKDLAHEFGLPTSEGSSEPSSGFLMQVGQEIRNLTDSIIAKKFPSLPALESEILSFTQEKDCFIEGYQALGYDGEEKYQARLNILENQKKAISEKLVKELHLRRVVEHLVGVLKDQNDQLAFLVPALENLGFE